MGASPVVDVAAHDRFVTREPILGDEAVVDALGSVPLFARRALIRREPGVNDGDDRIEDGADFPFGQSIASRLGHGTGNRLADHAPPVVLFAGDGADALMVVVVGAPNRFDLFHREHSFLPLLLVVHATSVAGWCTGWAQISVAFPVKVGSFLNREYIHGLRHQHASLLAQAGVSVKAAQKRLGHSNPLITLDIYTHVLGDADKESATALDTLLGNKPAAQPTRVPRGYGRRQAREWKEFMQEYRKRG